MSQAWLRQNYDDINEIWNSLQLIRQDLVTPVLDRCQFENFLKFCTSYSTSEFDNPYLPIPREHVYTSNDVFNIHTSHTSASANERRVPPH